MIKALRWSFLSSILWTYLSSQQPVSSSCNYTPWFLGTLLEYDTVNEAPGAVSVLGVLYAGGSYGSYDNHWNVAIDNEYTLINPEVFGYIGLTRHIQIDFLLQAQTISYHHHTKTHFGDAQLGLGFQFLWEKQGTAIPNIRVDINESFPTGAYENLDPILNGNDAFGSGAYGTIFTFVINKTFDNIPCHPYIFALNVSYTYFAKTSIHGLNSYGGGFQTDGKIHPGGSLDIDFAIEYAFSQHYALALDLLYSHIFPARFHGHAGFNPDGTSAVMYTQSQDLLSLTPAVEFSLSPNIGFYLGAAFSIIGRNATAFAQGVFGIEANF